jgi:hypothetical protein
MFTAQAPTLLSSNALPPDQLRQLAQVFANCNQSLTHRGQIDLKGMPFYQQNGMLSQIYDGLNAPPWAAGSLAGNGQTFGGSSYFGGNYYGVDGPASTFNLAYSPGNRIAFNFGSANPGSYEGGSPYVFPPIGGGYTSNWNTYQGDNNAWDFSDRSTRNQNFYYGGPSFQVAGDSYFDNSITQNSYATNQYVTNLTVDQVNGEAAVSDRGDPAIAGPGGAPGAPGNPEAALPAVGAAGGINPQVIQNLLVLGGNVVIGGGGGVGGLLVQLFFQLPGGERQLNPRQEELLRRNREKAERKLEAERLKGITAQLNDDCTITLTIPRA